MGGESGIVSNCVEYNIMGNLSIESEDVVVVALTV